MKRPATPLLLCVLLVGCPNSNPSHTGPAAGKSTEEWVGMLLTEPGQTASRRKSRVIALKALESIGEPAVPLLVEHLADSHAARAREFVAKPVRRW
ncbi:MAG: hypothetical protein JKY65_32515 [Planctomycetes bacterium]|nr:hypothetical protein [Planctomycetota bacterium]